MAEKVSAGNAASASFVSCMQSTSGSHSASHASTRGRRALRELTFQVAMRISLVTLESPTVHVTMWSDYICPWAYLGRDRTDLLRSLGVDVTSRPYELHPELPPEGRTMRPGGRLAAVYESIGRECAE